MKPAVSVIMPCYNSEAHLEETVESILKQSLQNIELIIVDTGSVDGTLHIIKSFTDPRIKLIRLPNNTGHYNALNTGFNYASGKYVCPIKPGDIASSNKMEIQFRYMEDHNKTGCVGSAATHIDEQGNKGTVFSPPVSFKEIKCQLLNTNCIVHSTLMFRNSFLTRHTLKYNEKYTYAAGYDLLTRCVQFFPVACIAQSLLEYRKENKQPGYEERRTQKEQTDKVRLNYINSVSLKLTPQKSAIYLAIMNGTYLFPEEVETGTGIFNSIIETNVIKKFFNQHYLFNMFRLLLVKKYLESKLGDWSIELAVIRFLNNTIKPGSKVLEFGSGSGTEALLRKYKVTSIEHDLSFCYRRSIDHTCIHAPIEGNWYAPAFVKNINFNDFDCIIVDGPVGDCRKGILQNLSLFSDLRTPVIFDDAERELDHCVIRSFCESLKFEYKIITGDKKSFAYCMPPATTPISNAKTPPETGFLA